MDNPPKGALQMTKNEPRCCSCRNGEIDRPADGLFVGTWIPERRVVPFRGYLCNDHAEMMADDGAILKCIKELKGEN